MPAHQFLKRKERLLISAIQLLDEGGLAGVTTREMARREGISEPAVYRHFTGKTDILLAILDQFSAFDRNLEDTVRENEMLPVDAIRHICRVYAAHYAGYPEIANVMFSLDLWKYDPQLEEKYAQILNARHLLMRELVVAGIESGVFKSEIKVAVLAELLANLVISSTHHWRFEGMTYSLVQRMEDMLDMILPALMDEPGGSDERSRA